MRNRNNYVRFRFKITLNKLIQQIPSNHFSDRHFSSCTRLVWRNQCKYRKSFFVLLYSNCSIVLRGIKTMIFFFWHTDNFFFEQRIALKLSANVMKTISSYFIWVHLYRSMKWWISTVKYNWCRMCKWNSSNANVFWIYSSIFVRFQPILFEEMLSAQRVHLSDNWLIMNLKKTPHIHDVIELCMCVSLCVCAYVWN